MAESLCSHRPLCSHRQSLIHPSRFSSHHQSLLGCTVGRAAAQDSHTRVSALIHSSSPTGATEQVQLTLWASAYQERRLKTASAHPISMSAEADRVEGRGPTRRRQRQLLSQKPRPTQPASAQA